MQIHLGKNLTKRVLLALPLIITLVAMGCNQQSQSDSTTNAAKATTHSSFFTAYKSILPDEGKQGWPTPYLWKKAPELVVEKWLTEAPETQGKYVLLDFWATWCAPCLRMIPKLNQFQKEYGNQLVIIGISEEVEEDVLKFKTPKIGYAVAIDTQKRLLEKYTVGGLPYAVLIEPNGYVVYQGYGLNEEIVKKSLAVGSTK